MQCRSQAIDIGSWRSLSFAILFWSGITRRTQRNRIFYLSQFEMPGNPKINQVDLPVWCAHDIIRLEIAEDDRWLAHVQVGNNAADLYADLKYLNDRKIMYTFPRQVLAQCFAFNEVHHQIPASLLTELIVDARQIRMDETCK